jgi:hypothetical protein
MRKISNLALFAFLMPLAGCPGGDDTGTTDVADTGTVMTQGTTEEPMTTTMEPETSGTTMEPETTGVDSTTGGGGAGFCAQSCEAVADCVPMGGMEADYACTDGFCEYIGVFVCDDTTCPAAAGLACADVGGVNTCTIPCPNGDECDLLMQECTGMDDDMNAICQAPPPPPCGGAAEGAPCDFGGADQYGVCMDGVCSCADDTECTAAGFACNS